MRLAIRMAVATSLLPLTILATQAQAQTSSSRSLAPPRAVSDASLTRAFTPSSTAPRTREPVQLADRSLRATNVSIRDVVPAERPTPTPTPTPEPEASGDPYGFAAILNNYRASAGLPPVAYDPNLSNWASQNNAAQSRRGLGHHVNPNCFQNCAWNYTDIASAATSWINSAGHRQNMLSPSISRFGIAYGPGPYWTWNAQ
jgi:uncharacterized protein YkwD